ncbi:conserved hypothetical protein [Gammaproteobacteria bacterium]
MTLEQTLVLALQMAEALKATHDQGVLHLGLELGSLLVHPETGCAWTVKLIDLGLGAMGHSPAGMSLTNRYQFSAPEQWGLIPDEPGPRSDVYAFGKILCHALFQNTQPTLEDWESLGFNHPLVRLINRCIHAMPAKRPQAFSEVLDALEAVEKQQALATQQCQPVSADARQRQAEQAWEQGDRYHEGRGVERDDIEAAKWYRLAAEQGHINAQCRLGDLYANGWGVARDDAEAAVWYQRAAGQGDADGQFNLGVLYANGWGVARNDAEAVKWFQKAAEQGDVNAQFNLGDIYARGLGVTRDDSEAVSWYRMAAEQGDASSQYHLGDRYAKGLGVARDDVEAVRWYQKAASNRNPNSVNNKSRRANLGT